MEIKNNCVVTLEYTLKDQLGNLWETSKGDAPWIYLHGHGGIIPGLEPELVGKQIGDQLTVTLPPEQAYGPYEKELANQVPREAFVDIDPLEVGLRLSAQTSDGGTHTVTVTEITEETVTVDANHPLAGQLVSIEVEITDIRDATEEEIAHGHVHQDGHCH